MSAGLTPLHEFLTGGARRPLLLLLAATALLLLIACANVGNLLVVRALARAREMAVRIALGASRGRLVRQVLTEAMVLAAAGGMAGLVVGWAGTRALSRMQPAGMLPVERIPLDLRVAAFTALLTIASAAVFAVAPVLWTRRQQPSDSLRSGARAGDDGGMRQWGRALAVAEISLAVLLTISAGLLVRSYSRVAGVAPGFDPQGVVAIPVTLPSTRYDSAQKVTTFFDELLLRARAIPGVVAASASSSLPLTGVGWSSQLSVFGQPPAPVDADVVHRELLPGYFAAMRVEMIAGRDFTDADRDGSEPVVIVNEALTDRYFQGRNPIGARISFDRVPDSASVWRTIVGVVRDERQTQLAEPARMEVFAPLAQDTRSAMNLVVRAGRPTDVPAVAVAVRAHVAELDPRLALGPIRTMDEVRDESLARTRFLMILLLGFAAAGFALALVGVYGVMAQHVQHRTRELGIRVALGADPAALRWWVLRHGGRLLAVGIAIGTAASLATSRALGSQLFQIAPTDPVTHAVVAAAILVAGVLACWIPARRATAADPLTTLRADG